ncbi:MAG: hypothetical protein NWE89_15365 [Candidatus Bathyarchaeota archaeon]|nr:hypothetical protein [Candidatus Bathyarchaeota archaeon]
MRFYNFRVESSLKNALNDRAEISGFSLSDVVRDVIWIGIGIQENGGVKFIGPGGFPLIFAQIKYGGKKERVNVWLEEEQFELAESIFSTDVKNVMRGAVSVGIAYLDDKDHEIVGRFGVPRPFSIISFPELTRKESVNAYFRLKQENT